VSVGYAIDIQSIIFQFWSNTELKSHNLAVKECWCKLNARTR